ncbi:MAG: hypothetical protein PHS70_05940, partial [Acidithiobacillus sp.]|nr:hypothetical protein [Acidithiobacillus sp.]
HVSLKLSVNDLNVSSTIAEFREMGWWLASDAGVDATDILAQWLQCGAGVRYGGADDQRGLELRSPLRVSLFPLRERLG